MNSTTPDARPADQGHCLSIVIPAYRSKYLGDTLASLSAQSCQAFDRIVADDGSPEDIGAVVAAAGPGPGIRYVRFPKNIGRLNLTGHWDRAVRLASTPWVTLLGDDDRLDPTTVACFLAALSDTQGRYDLYRFNTRRIDGDGVIQRVNPSHPQVEEPAAFVRARLLGERSSYTCEYVFRRSALERIGGFVPFPLAWCSDDATWVALGAGHGIYTIAGPRASWRLSSDNISAARPAHALAKLRAQGAYLKWLALNLPNAARHDVLSPGALAQAGADWFHEALWKSDCWIPLGDAVAMSLQLTRFTGRGVSYHLARLLKHDWDRIGRWAT